MPPASYMQAAQAIDQPLMQAEQTSLAATNATTKATLEAEKPQIQTDYTSAIDKLSQSVQDQTAQINSLYSQRLGGNFSGLQGNDMGQMFSRANEQMSIIGQTEANKLAQITTEEGNADVTYQADLAALTPKYQSMELSQAASAYSADVKAAQTQANSDRSYNLSVARLGLSESKAASTAAADVGKGFSVKQLSSGNKAYTGPNGQTNLYQYASNVGGGDPSATYNIIKQELSTGSQTDKGAYNGMLKLEKQGLSQAQILQSLSKSNAYIFQ